MNDGTWVWYTTAALLVGLAAIFLLRTAQLSSVVPARRHGSPAGGKLALAAAVLVWATVEAGMKGAPTWQYLALFAAFAAVVAGFSLVGIAWAEDVAAGVPNKHVRLLLGIIAPLAVLAIGLVSYWATRAELPSRLATHFGSNGPDDSMTVGQLAVTTSILAGVGIVFLLAAAAIRRPVQAHLMPFVGFLGGFLAGLGAGIFAFTLFSQRGLIDWRDASSGLMVAAAIGLAVVFGVISARLATQLPSLEIQIPDSSQRPTMDLRGGQHAVWSSTTSSKWLLPPAIAVLLFGPLLLFAPDAPTWLIGVVVFAGVALLSLASIRVTADSNGLRVKYGFLPWPSTHISVDQIDAASVIDVRPMEWGGWGYRGSLKLMRQAAVVLRAGPGIRLDLDDGKVFVITVDDPETPVALLNAEVSRL